MKKNREAILSEITETYTVDISTTLTDATDKEGVGHELLRELEEEYTALEEALWKPNPKIGTKDETDWDKAYARKWTKQGRKFAGSLFQLGVSVSGMGSVSAYYFDSDKEIEAFVQLGQKLLKTLRPYGRTDSELYALKQWIYFKVLSMGKGKPDLDEIKRVTEPKTLNFKVDGERRPWQDKRIPDSLYAAGKKATKRIQTATDLMSRLYKMVQETPKARKAQKAMALAVRGGRPDGSLGS